MGGNTIDELLNHRSESDTLEQMYVFDSVFQKTHFH